MEGNYSKNPFKAELEYRDDLIQAGQLQMQEYYWESYLNAAEKLRKEHHYLVDGAVLRCSKSTTNPIIITQSKGQLLKYEECTEDMLIGEGGVVLEDPDNMECFRAPEGKSEVRLKVLQNTATKNGAGQYFATVKDTKKGGITQYFVNGYVDGIDEALSEIRKGEKFKIDSNTHKLEVNGKSYQLPNGWYDRELNWEKAYNELQKIK